MIRLIELIGGLAAGIVGLLSAALLVFLLPYSVGTSTSNGTSTITTTTILPGARLTLIVAVLLGVLAIGVATGALLHVQRHLNAGRLLLLISTGLFLLGILLGGPTFWIGYSVALLLALISASMSLISMQRVNLP